MTEEVAPTGPARLKQVNIGQRALERGWIAFETFRDSLERLDEDPTLSVQELWVESGVLTSEQVSDLLLVSGESGVVDEGATTLHHDTTLIHRKKRDRGASSNPDLNNPDLNNPDLNNPDLNNPDLNSTQGTGPMPAVGAENPGLNSMAPTLFPTTGSGGADWASSASDSLSLPSEVVSDELAALTEGKVSDRYIVREEIGRGGSGRVMMAHDRALGRVVAMKIMRPAQGPEGEARVARFIREARATGQLEHPNIIPIYDVGLLPGGEAYYTMKLLTRQSLRGVLHGLAQQDPSLRKEYPLNKLLTLFLPVCQAIAYAHAQGMVHRDLKPDNIVLGEYGEVLVTDWGLARLLADPPERFDDVEEGPTTLGTPAYMPPEQARGELHLVDELSDIYGLGTILYEILTLSPPYDGPSALDILEQVATEPPENPSKRATWRHIPRPLEEICDRAMARMRGHRYPTALELHNDVEQYVQGGQAREAKRKVYLGRTSSREYFRAIDEVDAFTSEVRRLREDIPEWSPLEQKRPLWNAEDSLHRALTRMAQSYSDSVRSFTQALAYEPGSTDARRGLADLYWSRFQVAEKRKELIDQIHFASLIRQNDTEGQYAQLLEGNGRLSLTCDADSARVTLMRYRELNRVMVAWEPEEVGGTPIAIDNLEMGSYLARVEAPGFETVDYPFRIDRCGHWEGHVFLPPQDSIPEGFVYVPGGPFIAGGDPNALNSAEESNLETGGFLIARDHVTFGDYMEFLNHLQGAKPDEAMRRAPQARDGDGPLALLTDEGWKPKYDILIEGDARQRYPADEGHHWRLPIMCIDVEDALAFVEWRRQRDGQPYRLPTAMEWEKAARGVDGRNYPWGDKFDATFCKMRLSREEMAQPEPVGTFETDESVYGVRDMAGTIQNWARDDGWIVGNVDALPGNVPGERIPETTRACGGAWNHFAEVCRPASRISVLSVARNIAIGFRLALDAEFETC